MKKIGFKVLNTEWIFTNISQMILLVYNISISITDLAVLLQ